MTSAALLVFAGALIADSASPGPTVAALIARVFSRGMRDVLPFLIAIWLGEAVWLTAAVAGLAALASAFRPLFEAIKWVGIAYLFRLAWTLFMRSPEIDDGHVTSGENGTAAFLSGISIAIGNPKNMVFYLTLLPSIIDVHGTTVGGGLQLVTALLLTLVAVDLSWVLLAAKAGQLLRSSRAVRRIDQISGGAMALAAAAMAVR